MPVKLEGLTTQNTTRHGGFATSQTARQLSGAQIGGTRLEGLPKVKTAQPIEQAPQVTTETSPLSFWQRLRFSFGDKEGKKKALEQMGYKVYTGTNNDLILSKNGNVARFDEKGLSWNDIADIAGDVLPFLGFAAGTALTKSPAIGAGAGAGAGEAISQAIGRGLGVREKVSPLEVATEAGAAAAGAKLFGYAPKVIQAIAPQFAQKQLVGQAGERLPGFFAREAVGGGLFGGIEAPIRTGVETGDIGQAVKSIPGGVAFGAAVQPLFGLGFRALGAKPSAERTRTPAEIRPGEFPPGGGTPPGGPPGAVQIAPKDIPEIFNRARQKVEARQPLSQEEMSTIRTLQEAAAKRTQDPSARLTPNEELTLRLEAERRVGAREVARTKESENITSTARRMAIMQEVTEPGRIGTMKDVNDTIERILALKNPTPEESAIIKRINKIENNLKQAIVKAGGVDKYLDAEISPATKFEAAATRRNALNEYEEIAGKTVETQPLSQPPVAPVTQPTLKTPEAPTPEIRLATSRVETPTMGREVSTFKPIPEEAALKEGVVSQETLRVRTRNIDLLKNENTMLEGFYSDLGALSLDPRYVNNPTVIARELTPLYPELTAKEIGAMVGEYMKFAPKTPAEKARIDDAIEAQLERRIQEAETIEGAGEEIIPGSSLDIAERLAPSRDVYKNALTRELEKSAKKISIDPPPDTKFPWKWTWERNNAYSDYFEAKVRGDILPNKAIENKFSAVQKKLANIADDTISLEVDGKKLSFEDYILAKLAEAKDIDDLAKDISTSAWRDTRFGDLIRGLENWPKFRGFTLKTNDVGVVLDSAGNDITKEFQRRVLSSRTGRVESLAAPYPRDIKPYIYAIIEKHGIPSDRAKFIEWQRKILPEIQQTGKTSEKITEGLGLIPEIRYTPEQKELLRLAREKVGEDVGLGVERRPLEFARPAPEEPSRPRTPSEFVLEKMAIAAQRAEERIKKGRAPITTQRALTPDEIEKAMFRRKWAKIFGKEIRTLPAETKAPSLSPEEVRARIDPDNQLSDIEFATQYAESGGFRAAEHFSRKINKLAEEGDEFASRLKDTYSDEQIKQLWTDANEEATGRLVAEGEKVPKASTLLATPETTVGMRLEFPGAPEGFRIREPGEGPVSPEAARAGLERFAAGRKAEPTARLTAAGERPVIPENIARELDSIPDDILPLESISLPPSSGTGGRKVRVGNPLKMGALMQIGNEFRTAMATGDLSLLLRQLIMVGPRFPDIYAAAFPKSIKFMFNKGSYERFTKILESDPRYLKIQAESPTLFSKIDGPIGAKEESFMAKYIQKIPIIGNIIKASERAFHGTANSVRFDIYNRLLREAGSRAAGEGPEALAIRKQIAELVGAITGRGLLDPQGLVNRNRAFINSLFFSPGLIKSRVYFLDPRTYLDPRKDPFVRKEAFKAALAFAGTMTSLLGLAAAAGVRVGTDSNSSDFGKMRFGKTRIDLMGGFQQYIVALSRVITGEYTTSKGKKIDLTAGGPLSKYDIILRFLENKESPLFSFMTTMLKGTSFDGQPVEVQKEILQRMTPIVAQDIYDIAVENPELLPAGILSFLGAGVQTYK